MQIVDTKGDYTGKGFVFVWGKTESISDTRGKTASGIAGMAESADGGVW